MTWLILSALLVVFATGLALGSWLRGEADARRYGGLIEIPPFVYQSHQRSTTAGPVGGDQV